MEFIGSLAIALSIYAGGVFVLNETMTTGQFMSFLVSLLLAYQPVKALGNLNISIQEGLAGAERIFRLLDTSENKMEKILIENKVILNGDIILKNISFGYEEKNILENININIPEGKKVALVGLSGSGKSTIVNLIPRFFDNYKGEILISSQNTRNIHLKDLRNNIAYVSQETILFNDTISNNIRYGKLDAKDEEIKNIAKLSGITEFTNSFDKKLETVVGESGIKLSGGQRQRIAIARAIIKNAPILILDEATSSLDNIIEKEIYKTIKNLMKNKTILIIAHRLSTIEDSDIIYVINKGKVEDFGSHSDLLTKSATYKKLQLKEKLENEF